VDREVFLKVEVKVRGKWMEDEEMLGRSGLMRTMTASSDLSGERPASHRYTGTRHHASRASMVDFSPQGQCSSLQLHPLCACERRQERSTTV
jgi:hypothetical protein